MEWTLDRCKGWVKISVEFILIINDFWKIQQDIKKHRDCCHGVSDYRQSYFIKRKGSGNEWVSRMESAVGIHFRRGKQQVSRLLSRWNLSVYSSVWTSRNPDFDLGVDFVDTLKPITKICYGFFNKSGD